MTLDEFISLARENLTLFQRRYKRHHKQAPGTFPLDGTDQEWVERYNSHLTDLAKMRGDKNGK